MSEAQVEPVEPDAEIIVPSEGRIEIAGKPCTVRRLKTREFLSFMAILTNGFGSNLTRVQMDFDSPETIARDMSGMLLLAIPNAQDEFVIFLRAIVEPLDDGDRAVVASYLIDSPDLEDTLGIIEILVAQEKDSLFVLAGKVQAMMGRMSTLFTAKKTTAKKTTSKSRGGAARSGARST